MLLLKSIFKVFYLLLDTFQFEINPPGSSNGQGLCNVHLVKWSREVGVSSAPNPSSLQLLPSWWSLLPTLHLQPKVLQPIRHLWLALAALITGHRSRFSLGARTVPFKLCPTFTYSWIFRIFRWADQTLSSFQFGQIRSKHLETFSANQVTISHLLQINCANFTISHVSL